MKTKIVLSAVILFSVMAFILTKPGEKSNYTNAEKYNVSPPPASGDSLFIIGAYESGRERRRDRLADTLEFNLWFRYLGSYDTLGYSCPSGWSDTDRTFNFSNNFISNVGSILNANRTAGLKTFMHRPKIEWLVFGQRSDYQCEDTLQNPDLWFYRYREHQRGWDIIDNSSYGGNNLKVRYCKAGAQDSGYVVKSLIANREQINTRNFFGNNPYPGFGDRQFDWYIKPRIRIDSMDAKADKRVCRVEILDFNSNIIKSINITGDNFLINHLYYGGQYLDEFFGNIKDSLRIYANKDTSQTNAFNPDRKKMDDTTCKVDFRVFWFGECDMWIDYVRVEDERAHDLFGDPATNPMTRTYRNMLTQEIQVASQNPGSPIRFYTEEFEFNHLPCLKYVYNKLKDSTGLGGSFYGGMGEGYYCDHTPGGVSLGVGHYQKYFIDSLQPKELIYGAYPFLDSSSSYNELPNTLPDVSNKRIKAAITYPSSYDYWLQVYMDDSAATGWMSGEFIRLLKNISNLCKSSTYGMKFLSPIQTHLHQDVDGHLRELTNEELDMNVNVSISYGSKGIVYFQYNGWGDDNGTGGYSRGIVNGIDANGIGIPRINNIYLQPKWNKIISIDSRVKKWGPSLMKFDITKTNSYIYRKPAERSQMAGSTYIQQVKTYVPAVGISEADTAVGSLSSNQQNETYVQASVFDVYSPEPYVKYFMIINRRCSPCVDNTTTDKIGGRRIVTIDLSGLTPFNNWKIYNLENNNLYATIDKNNHEINLGNFMPGEGKLFKLVPVMQDGGTLVCNEVLSTAFDCDSMVFNNGYDLTIHCGTTINFKEKGKIVMNGGSFNCSYIPDNSTPDPCARVQLRGKNSGIWEGLSFDGCAVVNLENLEISNVGYLNGGGEDPGWQNCAISITNCFNFAIGDCIFNMTSPANGINLFFNNFENEFNWGNTYIYGCTFNVNNQSPTPVSVLSVASVNTPVKIENCNFLNGNNEGGPSAIFMNGVTGGVLQGNFVHKFSVGVYALSSSLDLFYNRIYSDKSSAVGLYGLSGSTLNLIPNLNYFTGGYNTITNTGEFSKNIDVENSHFNIDKGQNTFNLSLGYQEENNPLHLYGYFDGTQQEDVPATLNCFQIDTNNVNQTKVNVRWNSLEGDPVNFDFSPFSCNSENPNDYEVFSETGLLNDTIYKYSGGTGGGFKNEIQASAQLSGFKSACDSICISLRKRNYSFVESRSKFVISAYPDSAKSLDLISKLYFATLSLDSSGNKMGPLKTYLEGLILNNPGNVSLINRAFYFSQKCKVALRQFQSAMQGFYTIMQQNPYSYEGLVASWDYAATYVLDSLNGHSGGLSNSQFQLHNVQFQEQSNEEMIERTFSTLDTNKFTKQERKVITKNVSETMKSSRQKQVDAVDALQKKSEKGDVKAVVQLKQVKILNEVIKPKKPNTVIQLKKIISSDINMVFKKDNIGDKTKQNILPKEYNLSQNYPNPFNPNTKINYELPKDGKVRLVIYDILGRQIKSLVNNEFKTAGRYTVEFNGSQFASGVYFYRIQVEDGKGFTAVKKMVLVK